LCNKELAANAEICMYRLRTDVPVTICFFNNFQDITFPVHN